MDPRFSMSMMCGHISFMGHSFRVLVNVGTTELWCLEHKATALPVGRMAALIPTVRCLEQRLRKVVPEEMPQESVLVLRCFLSDHLVY